MSQSGPLRDHAGGSGNIMTLSSEGGPHTPPVANNFNFSGSIAGGSAANGAIEFITPGGPGAATDGQMDAVVRTDGVTIDINGSNQLHVIGGVFSEEFTVDAHTAPGTNPVIPNGSGNITVTGAQVAAGVVGTNVIRTDSLAANTYTIEIQRSQAVGVSTLADNGVSHFDSAAFDVDANGFVQLNGGGIAITSVDVDAHTAPGTDPVVPDATGKIVVTGGQVAAGTTTNVIRTDSLAANTYTIEVQRSQAVGVSTVGDNGVSHFDSARFTVDSNGFVSTNGSGIGETITGNSGGALSPTAGNWNIFGASTAAGTSPVTTSGAVSTLTVNVQKSQAIASTDATKVGLAAFDSSRFSVDANGFVTLSGTGVAETITGDTGGALSPTAGNWNIKANSTAGSSVSFSGSVSTLSLNTTNSSGTIIGSNAGNGSISGSNLVGLGDHVLTSATSAASAVAIGSLAANKATTAASFVAIGSQTLQNLTTGNSNTGIGSGVMPSLLTGASNIAIGIGAGNNYTSSESNNILIANQGTLAESNAIHIGTQGSGSGQQNTCYIAGIAGVSVSNLNLVTINTSTGQLGSQSTSGIGQTITGDTGGAISPSSGNWNIISNVSGNNSGSSVSFSGSGSTLTLNVTKSTNTLLGAGAGNATLSNIDNVGLGSNVLSGLTSGAFNTAIGFDAAQHITSGQSNVAVGNGALQTLTAASNNVAIGDGSLLSLGTGAANTAIGQGSGNAYTGTESNNICIKNAGTLGESNTIHIGTQGSGAGQQNACFIAGITGVTVSNPQLVTINSSTGQLGVTTSDIFLWNVVTTNQTGLTNNGYICVSAGGALTISLPTTSAVGDIFRVVLDGATSWQITQATGQQIRLASSTTTLGATGSLTSTAQGNAVTLVCRVANTIWTAVSSIGNITVA